MLYLGKKFRITDFLDWEKWPSIKEVEFEIVAWGKPSVYKESDNHYIALLYCGMEIENIFVPWRNWVVLVDLMLRTDGVRSQRYEVMLGKPDEVLQPDVLYCEILQYDYVGNDTISNSL